MNIDYEDGFLEEYSDAPDDILDLIKNLKVNKNNIIDINALGKDFKIHKLDSVYEYNLDKTINKICSENKDIVIKKFLYDDEKKALSIYTGKADNMVLDKAIKEHYFSLDKPIREEFNKINLNAVPLKFLIDCSNIYLDFKKEYNDAGTKVVELLRKTLDDDKLSTIYNLNDDNLYIYKDKDVLGYIEGAEQEDFYAYRPFMQKQIGFCDYNTDNEKTGNELLLKDDTHLLKQYLTMSKDLYHIFNEDMEFIRGDNNKFFYGLNEDGLSLYVPEEKDYNEFCTKDKSCDFSPIYALNISDYINKDEINEYVDYEKIKDVLVFKDNRELIINNLDNLIREGSIKKEDVPLWMLNAYEDSYIPVVDKKTYELKKKPINK